MMLRAVLIVMTVSAAWIGQAAGADQSNYLMDSSYLEPVSTESCQLGCCQDSSHCKACCCDSCDQGCGWLQEFSILGAIDGSKQPQDFGVNANLGGQAGFNWGIPLLSDYGIGAQIGTGVTATANAVRVFEPVIGNTDRIQHYTTVGLFQRLDCGFGWGCVYDHLYEDSYDSFSLSQWRIRGSYDCNACNQIGITAMIAGNSNSGFAGATAVTLAPITQGHVYWRRIWQSGTQTTFWAGVAEGHSEANLALGDGPPADDQFLFGADILAPLNDSFAIYGETNLMMPADTGTVDAFLGIQWFPGKSAYRARRTKFSPMMWLASTTSFSVDLTR